MPRTSPSQSQWCVQQRIFSFDLKELSALDYVMFFPSRQVDCFDRVTPLLAERILPDVQAGRTVLVVAHKNSIRGIIKYIDNLSNAEVRRLLNSSRSTSIH